MRKRLGKFDVSDNIINTPEFIEVLKRLKFVLHRIETPTSGYQFKYTGTSKAFDLIEESQIIPEYNIIIYNKYNKDTDSTKIEKVSAKRC